MPLWIRFDGLEAGGHRGTDVFINESAPVSTDLRLDRTDRPGGDGQMLGRDFIQKRVWDFTLYTNKSTEDEAVALASAWQRAWHDSMIRSGERVVPLEYSRDYVTWYRVYGRPALFTGPELNVIMRQGRGQIDLQFEQTDVWHYSEVTNELVLRSAPGASGGLAFSMSEPVSYVWQGVAYDSASVRTHGDVETVNLTRNARYRNSLSGWSTGTTISVDDGGHDWPAWVDGDVLAVARAGSSYTYASDTGSARMEPGGHYAVTVTYVNPHAETTVYLYSSADTTFPYPAFGVLPVSAVPNTVTLSVTVPETHTNAFLHIASNLPGAAGDVFYLAPIIRTQGDDVLDAELKAAEYFDGDTPDRPRRGGLQVPLRFARSGGAVDRWGTNTGDHPAPVTLRFDGPVSDPELELQGHWSFKVKGSLAWDEYLIIDPIRHTAMIYSTTSPGSRAAYSMMSINSRFTDLILPPGQHAFTFRAIDPTYTATVTATWPDTFASMQ